MTLEEIMKITSTWGFLGVVGIIILIILIKYLPQYIEAKLEQAKKRDYREEMYLEAIKNNSRVIENNNLIIKAYTDNAHKLENNLKDLITEFKTHDGRAEMMARDIKVLKDRKVK